VTSNQLKARAPRLRRGVGVEAGCGVVGEGMVGQGKCEKLVFLPGRIERRLGRTLLERSGGVWIYALSVLDQIRDDNRSPDEVDVFPAGLAAYYTNNITRWHNEGSGRWAQELAPLLGVLSAATEARTAVDLVVLPGGYRRDRHLDRLGRRLRIRLSGSLSRSAAKSPRGVNVQCSPGEHVDVSGLLGDALLLVIIG
jgi:hypothetical protein